jgi:hypothetical protein
MLVLQCFPDFATMQRNVTVRRFVLSGPFVTAVKDGGHGRDPLSEDAAIRAGETTRSRSQPGLFLKVVIGYVE